jgi:hypothetical protein
MNLHVALTRSIENEKPLAFLGKLLSDQRQIIEALREVLNSDQDWLLQYDREDWESEANDLADLAAEMFRRFG